MNDKSCFNCGYRQLDNTKCPLIGYAYPNDETAAPVCPYWTSEITYCGVCGQIIAGPGLMLYEAADGTFQNICERCKKASGTCAMCTKSNLCDFETNPSPIPKAVQKQVQQGPVTTITTIRNPSRIDITCRVNCPCWDENFGCLKENGTCGKYESRIQ